MKSLRWKYRDVAQSSMIDEFLKLLRAVEASRKVDGKSSHVVTERDVGRAV